MTDATSFGSWVKQQRMVLDLTREELAEQVGCAVETVRKIERDQRRPSKQIAERLASALMIAAEERPTFFRHARASRAQPAVVQAPLPVLPAEAALPEPLTTFFGRELDVAAVCAILQRSKVRLLTLLGPPGVGKTRLSLEVARTMAGVVRDGVVFVPLAAVTDATQVLPTIARQFEIQESGNQSLGVLLSAFLRPKHLLLVLDNLEQVLAAAPEIVTLLQGAVHLKVLTTSRTPLSVGGEHQWSVAPLPVPPLVSAAPPALLGDYPAVALFIDRARTVRPDLTLTDETMRIIAAICIHLDGLPLAIELAAGQSKLFPPQALLTRLNDRLGTLVGKVRDAATRQQTLRAAIDWSYDLLTPPEQVLFAELGVFVGGLAPEAVIALHNGRDTTSDDMPTELAALVDHSLVQPVLGPNGEPRFAMLETIRVYALERLGATGRTHVLRRRHAEYFLELAERAEPELAKAHVKEWVDRLEAEHDNFRAALSWLLAEGAFELAGRLAAALWQFWETRAYLAEGLQWLEAALAQREHLSLKVEADVVNAMGRLAHNQGNISRAVALFEDNLRLRLQIGEQRRIGYALNDLGLLLAMNGENKRGVDLLEAGLTLFRDHHDRAGVADVLLNYGSITYWLGETAKAISLLEEGLALFHEVGNQRGCMATMASLGFAYFRQGKYQRASELMRASMLLAHRLQDKVAYAYGAIGFGMVMIEVGDAIRGVQLVGAGEVWSEALGIEMVLIPHKEAALAHARAVLGDEAFAAALSAGRARPIEDVVAELGRDQQ